MSKLDNDDKISLHLSHDIVLFLSHVRLAVRSVVAKKGQTVNTIVLWHGMCFDVLGVSLGGRACGNEVPDSVYGSSRVVIKATS